MGRIAVPADADRHIPAHVVQAVIAALSRVTRGRATLQTVSGARDPRVRLLDLGGGWQLLCFEIDGGVESHDILLDSAAPTDAATRRGTHIQLLVHPSTGVPYVSEVAAPPVMAEAVELARSLVDQLGLDPALAAVAAPALARRDTQRIREVAAQAPQRSQAEALRCFSEGAHIEHVRGRLEYEAVKPEVAATDAVIRAALRGKASRMNYALLDAAQLGDLEWMLRGVRGEDWRAFLHPAQRRYVEARYAGPARVSGGAGTGKTVVLLHRARELWRRYPSTRIVLSTYTRNLAQAMAAQLRQLAPELPMAAGLGAPGIHVTTLDALAVAQLRGLRGHLDDSARAVLGVSEGALGSNPRLEPGDSRWRQALADEGSALGPACHTPEFFIQEYERTVLPRRITTEREFLAARRLGGPTLSRSQRQPVWRVIEAYRRTGRADGVLDFSEAGALVAHYGECGGAAPPIDHLLIDEAQDLSPVHWQVARQLTRQGVDDIFVAEDPHQRIYARRVTSAEHGLSFGSGRRLDVTYRTTTETLQWAKGVLEGHTFSDLAGEQPASRDYATRSGEVPRFFEAATPQEEREAAVAILQSWLEVAAPEDIAVLVRSDGVRQLFADALNDAGIPSREAHDSARVEPGRVHVMTMHRAKGVEFARVLIFGAGSGELPAWPVRDLPPGEAREDGLLRERSLLYVSATRARDALAVTWCGARSEFVPPDGWHGPGMVPPLIERAPTTWASGSSGVRLPATAIVKPVHAEFSHQRG